MDFENDEEFLSKASNLLGLEMTMTYLDLKDQLRELGYFGDWNDSDNILTRKGIVEECHCSGHEGQDQGPHE